MASQPVATPNQSQIPIQNIKIPSEGPKAVAALFDFSVATSLYLDLNNFQQTGKIAYLQTMFVDNSLNSAAIIIQPGTTNQQVKIPPYSQAYLPILAPQPPRITATCLNPVTVQCFFLNVPMPASVWNVNNAVLPIDPATGFMKTVDQNLLSITSGALGGYLKVGDVLSNPTMLQAQSVLDLNLNARTLLTPPGTNKILYIKSFKLGLGPNTMVAASAYFEMTMVASGVQVFSNHLGLSTVAPGGYGEHWVYESNDINLRVDCSAGNLTTGLTLQPTLTAGRMVYDFVYYWGAS